MLNVVEHTDEHLPSEFRWLLVGVVAIMLITTATLIGTVQLTPIEQKTLQTGSEQSFLIHENRRAILRQMLK